MGCRNKWQGLATRFIASHRTARLRRNHDRSSRWRLPTFGETENWSIQLNGLAITLHQSERDLE